MCLEMVTRRLIQLEIAVSRSPNSPDFAGLDTLMENPLGESRAAATKALDSWLTEQLKSKAQIQKQARLFREEMSFGSRGKGYATGTEDTLAWKAKRKAKAKAKSGAASSGGGAGDN